MEEDGPVNCKQWCDLQQKVVELTSLMNIGIYINMVKF